MTNIILMAPSKSNLSLRVASKSNEKDIMFRSSIIYMFDHVAKDSMLQPNASANK